MGSILSWRQKLTVNCPSQGTSLKELHQKTDLEKEAFFLYPYDETRYFKTIKQRKKCTKEQCSLWRGVDSDNLVWCNDWAIGDCKNYSDNYGKPYGDKFISLEVAEKLQAENTQLREEIADLCINVFTLEGRLADIQKILNGDWKEPIQVMQNIQRLRGVLTDKETKQK